MKRRIDGTALNTDTATTIAEGRGEALYQNRRGVYFSVVGEGQSAEWLVHGDAEAVRRRCADHQLTIVCSNLEHTHSAAMITVRAPLALKAAIEGCAREAGVSTNVLVLRALEEAVSAFQRRRGRGAS